MSVTVTLDTATSTSRSLPTAATAMKYSLAGLFRLSLLQLDGPVTMAGPSWNSSACRSCPNGLVSV